MNHDFLTCPHCTTTYAAFKTCWGCMMGNACETPERCETPSQHVCPEPFDPETARYLLGVHSAPGAAPVSMKTKARIALGLKGGHN
jgi:hypothetical protein